QKPNAHVVARQVPDSDKSATFLVLRPPAAYLQSAQWNPQKLQQASEVVGRRLLQIGVRSPSVTVDTAANTLTVEIPTGQSAQDLTRLLTRPAALEFRYVKQLESEWRTEPEIVNGRQTWTEAVFGTDGKPVSAHAMKEVFSRPPEFSG